VYHPIVMEKKPQLTQFFMMIPMALSKHRLGITTP